jgi:hypothetical protein
LEFFDLDSANDGGGGGGALLGNRICFIDGDFASSEARETSSMY